MVSILAAAVKFLRLSYWLMKFGYKQRVQWWFNEGVWNDQPWYHDIFHCHWVSQVRKGVDHASNEVFSWDIQEVWMEHCNATITSTEPRLHLSKKEEGQNINPMRYLWNTRPNLAFSVRIVNRFMGKLNASHLEAANRIMRYVKFDWLWNYFSCNE